MSNRGKRKSVPPVRLGDLADSNQISGSSQITDKEFQDGSDYRPATGGTSYMHLQDNSDIRSDSQISDSTEIFYSETGHISDKQYSTENEPMVIDDDEFFNVQTNDPNLNETDSDDPDWEENNSDWEINYDPSDDESETSEYLYANTESEDESLNEDEFQFEEKEENLLPDYVDRECDFNWGNPLEDNFDEYERTENLLKKFPFTETTGYVGNKKIENICDSYILLVDDQIMEIICQETNRYAKQEQQRLRELTQNKNKRKKKLSKRVKNWRELTKAELKIYLGIRIMMGCNLKNKISAYWEINDKDACSSGMEVRKYMSLYRFENISRFLHFADNQQQPNNDRIFKIRNLLDLLNKNFSTYFKPDQNLCIDESQLQWRGRFFATIYNPNKAHPYGQKLYKLCFGNGYTIKIILYSGKEEEGIFTPSKVVLELLRDFLDKGYILCTDNFYTSLPLAVYLLERKTHLLGTMRKNRKYMPVGMKSEVKAGQMLSYFENNEGILIFRFRDYSTTKKDFIILSTTHSNERVLMLDHKGVQRIYRPNSKSKDRTRIPMTEPQARKDYNICKDPVDTSDSKTARSSPHIKHYKWYQRSFDEFVLNTAVVNAYEIVRTVKGKNFNSNKQTVPEERKQLYMYLMNSGLQEMRNSKMIETIIQLSTSYDKSPLFHNFVSDGSNGFYRCRPCMRAQIKNPKNRRNRDVVQGDTKCNECNEWMCNKCFKDVPSHRGFGEITNSREPSFTTRQSNTSLDVTPKLTTLIEPVYEKQTDATSIPFTNKMEKFVTFNMNLIGNEYPIVHCTSTNVYADDLRTTANKEWFNDSIVDYYFHLISNRPHNENYPRVYSFPKYVFDFIQNNKQNNIGNPTEYGKNFNIFDYDIIFFPMLQNGHWSLTVINVINKKIQYYDSLDIQDRKSVDNIVDFLIDVHFINTSHELDLEDWHYQYQIKSLPKQLNTYDCGVFMCKFGEYISRNAPITFTQEHINYFRKCITYEIVTEKLLTD